jgi:NAD(P)-dependent dehydrogenase (short-subunit alcohol dehydrogenase family)
MDKTIVITGASDGIGAAAARALHGDGVKLVLVGRSKEKTEAIATELGADHYVADFARLDDVRALAAWLLERYPRIDVLANNAGGIMGDREVTVDGHEKTLQVNHLAPFHLTTLLIDRLVESSAVVIATSSVANKLYARLDMNNIELDRGYSANLAYGNAKLANILFTRELDRRYGSLGIHAVAFHPGVVGTSFASNTTSLMRFVYGRMLGRFLLSPAKGADTLVWLATTDPGVDWKPGGYYEKRKPASENPQASDAALAAALWEYSLTA